MPEQRTDQNIELKGISKSYGKKQVLKDLNLNIECGSLIGIEGENGSGKSTLMNIMAGFSKADKGSIDIPGRMGFCPQSPILFMQLSAIENIRLFSQAYGIRGKKNDLLSKRIDTLLNIFRFNEALSEKCFKFSGGTIQKLNLVLALLHDPDVLLLDEPYAAFDWETYRAFWNYADDLVEKGKTLIVISHIIYDRGKVRPHIYT